MLKVKSKRKSKNLKEKKISGIVKKVKVQSESVVDKNTPIVFSWITTDFIKNPLTDFYLVMAVFGAMAVIGWGFYNKNFITIVTFVMMVIVIILVLNEDPKKMEVKVTENGVDINDEHYNYSEFKSFKISHSGKIPMLVLGQRKAFSVFKTIYIEDEPVNDLESFLGIYLEKEEEDAR